MATKEVGQLREFGRFRLDTRKKVLWHDGEPVPMPLKEIEVLSVLVENDGQLVTKDDLMTKVWADSFVEESNLSRHIYLLRKTFKDFGENESLIENVPRRGYRFTGDVREVESTNGDIIIERQALTQTLIEDLSETPSGRQDVAADHIDRAVAVSSRPRSSKSFSLFVAVGVLIALLVGGFAIWRFRNSPALTTALGIKSIAVLPFKTIQGGSENEHQELGLADVLITRLSNIKDLNVRPMSAILALENQNLDSAGTGQRLKVDAVLEGTIYRTDTKVRVTARLVKTSDNSSIWAGQFEKPLQDEIWLQDEIALQLVEALALNLSGRERERLTMRYTESADAYQLYLKGRYHWNKRNFAGMLEAERLFRNAIDKDPRFALAHVGLADTLATRADQQDASNAVQKALELDPNLAEAHATLGFIKMFHEWKWQEAEASLKKSIDLNPNYATAHHWYATLLAIEGKTNEAKAEMRRALEINPLSHNFYADLGQLHYFAREYDKAKEYCGKALEIYPDFMFAHQYLYYTYLRTGEYDKALEESIKADKINIAFANQSAERQAQYEVTLNKYRKAYEQDGIKGYMEYRFSYTPQDATNFYMHAMKYAFLGEKEKALDNLEKAIEGKAFLSAFLKADPIFDNLRSEPRYQEILSRLGLQAN